MKALQTIIKIKTIKGTSFVGVRNYTNKAEEVSNQTFVVGINYANLLANDLKTINEFDLKSQFLNEGETYIHQGKKQKSYTAKEYNEIVVKGYNELVASLIKRTSSEKEKAELLAKGDSTIVRSVSQSEAYDSVSKGLKAKDGALYIYGLCVAKTVLKAGNYEDSNPQLKTVIKNQIKKLAELRELKYKQFKLGQTETLKLQGAEI